MFIAYELSPLTILTFQLMAFPTVARFTRRNGQMTPSDYIFASQQEHRLVGPWSALALAVWRGKAQPMQCEQNLARLHTVKSSIH